ncbi:MAG TPA: hypothetical protein PKI21_14315 [Nitrospira sp.]|nr:hypothetical protein [Nitrospira sp.]HPV83851.1 hypothetical protein [Nitrospira sp.]
MSRQSIASLWEEHSREGWPQFSSPNEGQLMTLDTVIGGCAVFYLDGEPEMDGHRLAILEDCVADLDGLLEELTDDSLGYFQRLRRLATALVDVGRQP